MLRILLYIKEEIFYYTLSGVAGFWVSINRIITKSLLNDERGNTSMFFILSNMTILLCFVLHQVVRKTDFVQFYITLCQERNRITLEPTEDVGLVRNHIASFIYVKVSLEDYGAIAENHDSNMIDFERGI